MADKRDGELMTTSQVADRFNVDRHTVTRWIRLGQLPAIRTPGGTYRVRCVDVDALLRRQSAE